MKGRNVLLGLLLVLPVLLAGCKGEEASTEAPAGGSSTAAPDGAKKNGGGPSGIPESELKAGPGAGGSQFGTKGGGGN